MSRRLGILFLSAAMAMCLPISGAYACDAGAACIDDLDALLNAEAAAAPANMAGGEAAGLSISVDGETIVGSVSRDDENRQTDVALEAVGLQMKFDGLGVTRQLSVSTEPERRSFAPGDEIVFRTSSNYAEWIARAEIRVFEPVGRRRIQNEEPLAIIEVDAGGRASWIAQAGLETEARELAYTLRVYDRQGRFDETVPLALRIAERGDALPLFSTSGEGDGRGLKLRPQPATPAVNEDRIAVSNIPLEGGVVTVYGERVPEGAQAEVLGRPVAIAPDGSFVTQTILPPGEHVVDVRITDATGDHSVEFDRDISIPDNEWFYVGIADATFGKRVGKDSRLLHQTASGEYDSVYRRGRLAFYLKGKVKGRYLITAALDTTEDNVDELFRNMDKKDPRQLLRRLDPDDYYPIYGDDSTLVEDAPTSGKFYVRVDRGKSHVMWGNFRTQIDGVELARYERALYGAHADLRSDESTSFGEPVSRITGFAAQPGTLPQRDEFLGSGGSVYFLQRQDINQGSEQVTIEIRDGLTGTVIERRALVSGEDYEFDYVQGVIILRRPLSSIADDSAYLQSANGGNRQYLVVSYEYTPVLGNVDGYSYGGRAEAWVDDRFRFGATGYQETTGQADQTLYGADFTWRYSEKTWFEFEWARSKGDTFAFVKSTDGGIIFNPVSGDNPSGASEAWRAALNMDFRDIDPAGPDGSFGVAYEHREAGFNAPGRYASTDERLWNAHVNYKPFDGVELKGEINSVTRGDGATSLEAKAEAKIDLGERETLELGAVHSRIGSSSSSADGTGARTDLGAKLTRSEYGDDKVYVFGQATVQRDRTRDRNDRIGAGFEAPVSDKITASAEISYGTAGIGLIAGLSYEPTVSDRYYIGYRMMPDTTTGDLGAYDPFGRDNGAIVVGARRQLTDSVTAWTEHNADLMGTSRGLLQAYGVEYSPDPMWIVTAGLEAGTVYDELGSDFERYAPSFAISYNEDGRKIGGRLEVRFEDSSDNSRDRTTWLGTTHAAIQYDDDWRFLAKADVAISDSAQDDVANADYIEASVGWAYRPVENDRFNALFKYTYLHDLPAPNQIDSNGAKLGPKQRSHVLSGDFIYDLTPQLSVGAKYGLRVGEVSTTRLERDFTRSTAQLGIIRTDFHVLKNWDVMLEGRALWLDEAKQANLGVLAGVYRHVGDNLKLGVGYNFGNFSDDLTDLTLDDEGVFVNLVGKF